MIDPKITTHDVLGPAAGQLGSVLLSLQQALGAMAGRASDPQFAGALDFFGALAGWAGKTYDVEERLVSHERDLDRLFTEARQVVAESADNSPALPTLRPCR